MLYSMAAIRQHNKLQFILTVICWMNVNQSGHLPEDSNLIRFVRNLSLFLLKPLCWILGCHFSHLCILEGHQVDNGRKERCFLLIQSLKSLVRKGMVWNKMICPNAESMTNHNITSCDSKAKSQSIWNLSMWPQNWVSQIWMTKQVMVETSTAYHDAQMLSFNSILYTAILQALCKRDI